MEEQPVIKILAEDLAPLPPKDQKQLEVEKVSEEAIKVARAAMGEAKDLAGFIK